MPDSAQSQADYAATLPEHLRPYWGRMLPSADPRKHRNYCKKQSRKTPMIPWHNGYPKCITCGSDVQ